MGSYGHTDVSENSGTPKSSILIGFSIINHPFWGTTILGNPHTNPSSLCHGRMDPSMPSNSRTTGKGLGTCFNRALCSHLSRPKKATGLKKTWSFPPCIFFAGEKCQLTSHTLNSKILFCSFLHSCMFSLVNSRDVHLFESKLPPFEAASFQVSKLAMDFLFMRDGSPKCTPFFWVGIYGV